MPSKNKIRKILSFTLICSFLLLAMIFICETANARAGGGGGYSTGGGGGGGSSSGGDILDIVLLLIDLIRLSIDYPYIGIPLLVIVVGVLVYVYYMGEDVVVSHTINKATKLYPSVSVNANLSKIKAKDPAFDGELFSRRAENAFKIIQKAWSKRDLSSAEAFLADGTYEQFLIQLNTMKENHILDVMENLKIKSSVILGYESDNNFDTVHLGITASGKNYKINEITKKYIEGDTFEQDFTEVWTFLRRTGVKTLKKPGLIEGYCPNCGAQIAIGRHAKCASCGAILRSGEYDWVLANITQACEWAEKINASIPGVKRYLQLDQGFNVQSIEDLVSVMFWRKNEAERISNVAPLRKIATNEYCDSQMNFYQKDSMGEHKFFKDTAVGTIRILGVDDVTSDKEDYIYAKVIWSGIPAKKASNGTVSNLVNIKQNIKEIFILKRKHGVKTDTKTSLSSAHCPNCGAAITDSLSNECDYCGSVLNDGTRNWVLENVLPIDDSRVAKSVVLIKSADSQNKDESMDMNQANTGIKKNYTFDDYSNSMNKIPGLTMIKFTIAMMLADGHIDPNEQKIIYDYGLRRGVNKDKVDSLVEEIKAQPSPVDYVIESTDMPMDLELVRMLIKVAYADGKVTKEEVEMLKVVGRKMNMTEDEMKKLLTEERMRIYRMSRAVIRESKNYN